MGNFFSRLFGDDKEVAPREPKAPPRKEYHVTEKDRAKMKITKAKTEFQREIRNVCN